MFEYILYTIMFTPRSCEITTLFILFLLFFQIFTGLYLMIESLVPTGKLLNDTRDRMIWLNKVHRFRPIVEKLIHLPQRDPYLYGAQSYKCMCKAK